MEYRAERTCIMYQRKNGTWCDTLPREGKPPKFFYGKTPAEVKKKMAEWDATMEEGILFREAADMWLAGQESKVREATYQNYAAPFRRVVEEFGDLRVTQITPNMVQSYINRVAAKGYTRSRVALYLGIIAGAFRVAITMEDAVLQYNPCSSVLIPKSCKNHVRDLPPRDAIDAIKRHVDDEFGLFPYLLIYSGLRKGEALALTDKDISKDCITVNKAVKHIGSRTTVGEPKSAAGYRDVVLLKPLADALPKKWKGYLFSTDGGENPLSPSEFHRLWDQYCLGAGLAHLETDTRTKHRGDKLVEFHAQKVVHHICPHQLRHEFATICFDAGLDPLDTADMMGHASEEVTRQIYTHIKNSRRKSTYNKLQEYVGKSY